MHAKSEDRMLTEASLTLSGRVDVAPVYTLRLFVCRFAGVRAGSNHMVYDLILNTERPMLGV
jgi:hypothetical protein